MTEGVEAKIEKILVCITAQENSRRLIKKAAQVAEDMQGELHILHVEKGNNILPHHNSAELLQQLFQYGSELGGEVHVICDDHVPERIVQFIQEMHITRLVLGETKQNTIQRLMTSDIHNMIQNTAPEVQIIILERKNPLHIKNNKVFSL